MQDYPSNPSSAVSRRQFLKASSLVAASAAVAVNFPSLVHAQAKQPINAVIIGVGGRGGGAGKNFLDAAKETGVEAKILAVADIFPEKAKGGTENFELPEDKCFSGFDAYQKALAIPGVNYAILATPPGFRAAHFKACVEAGKNVFMEKPVAVDGAGCRVMYEAAEMAKQKNLKVAAGTQRRHQAGGNKGAPGELEGLCLGGRGLVFHLVHSDRMLPRAASLSTGNFSPKWDGVHFTFLGIPS